MRLIRQHLKFMAKEHFSLLTANIRCIRTGIKRRTMAVCARDVLVREKRRHFIFVDQKKEIGIGKRNWRKNHDYLQI